MHSMCHLQHCIYLCGDSMDLDWCVRNPDFLRWISNAVRKSMLMSVHSLRHKDTPRIAEQQRCYNLVRVVRPRAYCSSTRCLAIKEVLMSARWKYILLITRDGRFGRCRSKFAVSMDVNGLGMSKVRTHGLHSSIRIKGCEYVSCQTSVADLLASQVLPGYPNITTESISTS